MTKKKRKADLPDLARRLSELANTYEHKGRLKESELLRQFARQVERGDEKEIEPADKPYRSIKLSKSPGRAGESDSKTDSSSLWSRIRKPLISIFLIFHCSAVAIWLIPASTPQKLVKKIVAPYMYYFGLWQYWCVFAPEPKTYNVFITALIRYKDGTESIWEVPRAEKMGYIERGFKERYRKWANESIYDPKYKRSWPDAARWIARNHSKPGKVPESVSLIRHWAYIPSPEEGLGKPSPEPNEQFTFYEYRVKPEDLS